MYLLTISLIVQKKYKIYMYPFLFNIFAHPPWAIFTLISLIIIKVNTKIKFFFSKANFIFLLVLILMNIIFYYQNTSFGLYNFIKNSKNLYTTSNKEITKDISRWEEKDYTYWKDGHNENPFFVQQDKIKLNILNKKYLDSFIDNIFIKFIKFFFFDLVLLIIFYLNNNKTERTFFKIIIVGNFLVYFYLLLKDYIFFININFHIQTLNHILDRLVVSRFLNISNIVVIVYTLSYVMNFFEKKNFYVYYINLFFILLAISIIIFADNNLHQFFYYGKYLNYYSLLIYFNVIFCIYHISFFKKNVSFKK